VITSTSEYVEDSQLIGQQKGTQVSFLEMLLGVCSVDVYVATVDVATVDVATADVATADVATVDCATVDGATVDVATVDVATVEVAGGTTIVTPGTM
jgi:hypothetical protein